MPQHTLYQYQNVKEVKILALGNYRQELTTRPEAEIFVGLKERGHEVTIMTMPDAEYIKRFISKGIKVIPFYPAKKREKESIKFLRKVLIEGQYDIFQMYTSVGYLNGIPAAKGLSVKLVLYRGFTGHIHWYDPSIYFKYFHPRVDGVVCNAEAIRVLFAKNAPWAKHKFRAIHKGHRVEWYENSETLDLTQFGVDKGDLSFVCVANERPMKGIKYLLKATYLLDKDAPFQLLLVGNGMQRGELKELYENSPLRDRIHILGYREDIINIVTACDVFVLASLWGESITKSVIQAMAMGKAPLITNIPGNKALVINEQSGLVVPKANAETLAKGINTYLQKPELTKIYGAKAKERIATEFAAAKTVDKYETFYNELVNS